MPCAAPDARADRDRESSHRSRWGIGAAERARSAEREHAPASSTSPTRPRSASCLDVRFWTPVLAPGVGKASGGSSGNFFAAPPGLQGRPRRRIARRLPARADDGMIPPDLPADPGEHASGASRTRMLARRLAAFQMPTNRRTFVDWSPRIATSTPPRRLRRRCRGTATSRVASGRSIARQARGRHDAREPMPISRRSRARQDQSRLHRLRPPSSRALAGEAKHGRRVPIAERAQRRERGEVLRGRGTTAAARRPRHDIDDVRAEELQQAEDTSRRRSRRHVAAATQLRNRCAANDQQRRARAARTRRTSPRSRRASARVAVRAGRRRSSRIQANTLRDPQRHAGAQAARSRA